MTYRPLGLRSASTGTLRPMRVKSSIVSCTFAACAIASRCSTALVEPPSAITVVMAFSKARARQDVARPQVRARRGRPPRPRPARHRPRFSGETAAWAELFGRLSPSASMAEAMVLAVYMPPHEPAPGQACDSRSASSASVIRARGVLPDGLEHGDDVDRLPLPDAGQDGAAVDEHRGPIEPRQANDHRRHVLVAAADGHQAVEALGAGDGLERIGDDLARHQRVLHALGAHRDAVGDGDGAEDDGFAAGRGHARPTRAPQPVDVHVARRHLAPGGADADLRFREVLARRSRRRAAWPVPARGRGRRGRRRNAAAWMRGRRRLGIGKQTSRGGH